MPRFRLHLSILTISFFLITTSVMGQNEENGETGADSPPAETAPEPVFVIGSSPIYKGNTSNARAAALNRGLAAAVDQAVIRRFTPDAVSAGFRKFLETAYSDPSEFVESYRILAEDRGEKHYRLLLSVSISPPFLEEKFAWLKDSKPEPTETTLDDITETTAEASSSGTGLKVLFLLAEQGLEDFSLRSWWGEGTETFKGLAETTMAQEARTAGLSVLGHGGGEMNADLMAPYIFQTDLNNADAVKIGKGFGADVVITGKAILYKDPDTLEEDSPTYTATVAARALKTETGEEIKAVLQTTEQQHAQDTEGGLEPMIASAAEAGKRLMESIAAAPAGMKETGESGSIELVVIGAQDLGNFVQFRRVLTSMEGVTNIQMKGMKTNEALLELEYPEGIEALAAALRDQTFDLFTLRIQRESSERLKATMRKR